MNLPGANKPTMYGTSSSIIGQTLVVYEFKDDFGQDPDSTTPSEWGSAGREVACC